jgi:hypothetical protein
MPHVLVDARVLPAAAALAGLLMAACGGAELHGKYSSSRSNQAGLLRASATLIEIEFKSRSKANFKVSTSLMATPTVEVDYEVHGREVTLKNPQGTMVATIADDGCLNFGDDSIGKLCKQTTRGAP